MSKNVTVDPPHVRLRPVAGHYDEPCGYRIVRTRGVDDWLMLLTEEGGGIARIETRHLPLRPGSAILYAPDTPHDYRTDAQEGHWKFSWVHFQPRPEWQAYLQWPAVGRGAVVVQLPPSAASRVLVLAREVVEVQSIAEPDGHILAMNAMERLLVEIKRSRPEDSGHLDDRIAKVLRWLPSALSRPLSLEVLARVAGLSGSRFAHLFRQQTGESPMTYVERLRLERARRLLLATDAPVASIAVQVGYSNAFHFATRFRRRYGLPPTALRISGGG